MSGPTADIGHRQRIILFSGTGKSLTATEVCSRTGMRHIDVGAIAKEQKLYDGFDEQYQCPILDEDRVTVCGCVGWVCGCVGGCGGGGGGGEC